MSVRSISGSFGDYSLERLLGRGGMGEVWLARDRTGSPVALKVLSAAYSAAPGYRRRFEREARLGAQVRNSHIVPIRAFGEVDGHLFLEMAYIEGVDLATRLQSGALAPGEAVEVISQAAEALDAAHAEGLVHRDVKPGNILQHTSGFVYLIDFGIARAADGTALTATGLVVGTLGYMAPERFTGTVDARSDVYSLACVLYEALTGHPPYGNGDPAQQMRAHLMSAPPRASEAARDVPPALDAVIARGMAKEPDGRYASAGEFAAAARGALGLPTSAQPAPPVLDAAASHPPTRVMTIADSPPTSAHRPASRTPGPRGFSPTSIAHADSRRKAVLRRWVPVAAGAALVAAAALWLLGGIGSDPAPSTTTPEASATAWAGPPLPSGDAQPAEVGGAHDGNFAFTVTDVVSNAHTTGSAATGGTFTIVTLTVTNVSDGKQAFTIADQRLVTTDGRSVAPDAAATAGLNPSSDDFDQIDPGGTSTIRLAFDLSGKDEKKDDKKKNEKKSDRADAVPSHLVLHGSPSSPGVTLPIR
ncbi:protein kinase [Nocardia amamiensis]|uniref:non-specific serine/threonine protein kinase n=1 Tax=Nocardia amamiensis TaxID=404578 RepID=A0ABS0CUF9_9NOCA|nr:serine/threonine-protein kinase [Nocardia amamiensis]MBF6300241.1 protein kinase [Nocardia amamiensis]